MKIEGTNLLLLTISAIWSSSRWPLVINSTYAILGIKAYINIIVINLTERPYSKFNKTL